MGRFSKISATAFKEIQTDAGVLLKEFDISAGTIEDADIIAATTGGVTANLVPTFSDWGSDIDNCPNNTAELKRIDAYDASIGFTSVSITDETIKLALAAADTVSGKTTPRMNLKPADFQDIWWVGDRSDGGLVAVHLLNALCTSGFALTTSKNGKGQLAMTITGHVSIDAQDVVPMEFYTKDGEEQ